MWQLTAEDVERIAIGAAILGTGGGGNPERGKLQALLQLEAGRALRVAKLDELADDALVVPMGGMGAPTIGLERSAAATRANWRCKRSRRTLASRLRPRCPSRSAAAIRSCR